MAFYAAAARDLPLRYLCTRSTRMAEARKKARMPKTITKGRM